MMPDTKKTGFFAFALLLSFTLVPGFAANKGDLKRGKKVFQDGQCAICHTDGGNNLNPERPLKGAVFIKRYPLNKDIELEKIIRKGITEKGMPSFGKDKLSDQDLKDVVVYIRSLTPAEPKKK